MPLAVAQEALRLGAQKLPITTKFIVRRDFVETSLDGEEFEAAVRAIYAAFVGAAQKDA